MSCYIFPKTSSEISLKMDLKHSGRTHQGTVIQDFTHKKFEIKNNKKRKIRLESGGNN